MGATCGQMSAAEACHHGVEHEHESAGWSAKGARSREAHSKRMKAPPKDQADRTLPANTPTGGEWDIDHPLPSAPIAAPS